MSYYLVQTRDEKTDHWSKAFKGGVELRAIAGSAVYFLVESCFRCWSSQCVGVIFRYLNDYPSFWRTLARSALEFVVVVLALISRTDVFWICHNVDKDTHCYHPKLNSFRRKILTRFSKRVFVTEPIFVDWAEKVLGARGKVYPISFGEREYVRADEKSDLYNKLISEWCAQKRVEGYEVLIWCAGSYAEKTLHYSYLERLIYIVTSKGFKVSAMVACGNLPKKIRESLEESGVFVVGEKFNYDESLFFDFFDFNFKIYDDLSMPYSVYSSVAMQLPVLTSEGSVLGEVVVGEDIGMGVDFKSCEIDRQLFEKFKSRRISEEAAKSFFNKRKWSSLFYGLKA